MSAAWHIWKRCSIFSLTVRVKRTLYCQQICLASHYSQSTINDQNTSSSLSSQPFYVHCWTYASPIHLHFERLWAISVQWLPTIFTISSIDLVQGRPTLPFPIGGRYSRSIFPQLFSVCPAIWPVQYQFNFLSWELCRSLYFFYRVLNFIT